MIEESKKHFLPEVIDTLVHIIQTNDGQEVAFCGFVNEEGKVVSVEPVGYGNEMATPFHVHKSLQGDVFLHNHPPFTSDPRENLKPSTNDLSLAQDVQNLGMGFFIIDNSCEWVNIILPVHPHHKLNLPSTLALFEPNGVFASRIAKFESRHEQRVLVETIVSAINQKGILIAEAGTGTGKSLAYLIPSLLWAVTNNKKVVISTHTIHLQDQLASKDLPLVLDVVSQVTGKSAEFAVLTGRGNYLCRNKLADLIQDKERIFSLFDNPDKNKISLVETINSWAKSTDSGTRRDFPQEIPQEIWEEIASEGETCLGKKCPYAGECFYQKAYMNAEKAQLIIANHSLLLSSIDPNTMIFFFPRFDAIVFDEAHHLEDVALQSQKIELSFRGLLQRLGRLYHLQKQSQPKGLLTHLLHKYKPSHFEDQETLEKAKQQLLEQHHQLTDTIAFIIRQGSILYRQHHHPDKHLRLTKEVENSPFLHFLNVQGEELCKQISCYIFTWNEIKNILIRSFEELSPPLLLSIDKKIQLLSEVQNVHHVLFNREAVPTEVSWITFSSSERSPNIKLCHTPLEVKDFLSRSLFSRKQYTLFLSATLSVNGEFSYFEESIGLSYTRSRPITRISLPSPFDYQKQAQIHILETNREFTVDNFFLSCIKDYILMHEGGTLVLFTSHTRLKQAYENLKHDLLRAGILPQAQGEIQKHTILTTMRKNPRTAVFATSSFWEGIDISGYNLRCVIIEKLPFDSPADPIAAAKIELLTSRSINAFLSYSLPRALLRMKQGVGRLIRSTSDKGIVLILDARTVTKRYATFFQKSLPPAKLIVGSYEKLQREAETFITTNFSSWLQSLEASLSTFGRENQGEGLPHLPSPTPPSRPPLPSGQEKSPPDASHDDLSPHSED